MYTLNFHDQIGLIQLKIMECGDSLNKNTQKYIHIKMEYQHIK